MVTEGFVYFEGTKIVATMSGNVGEQVKFSISVRKEKRPVSKPSYEYSVASNVGSKRLTGNGIEATEFVEQALIIAKAFLLSAKELSERNPSYHEEEEDHKTYYTIQYFEGEEVCYFALHGLRKGILSFKQREEIFTACLNGYRKLYK